MAKGWAKVPRAILDNVIWESDQPYDERSAYIDFVLRANYEEKQFRAKHSNDVITVKPGELFTSIGMLAERWRWSENRVRRYLKLLNAAGLAVVKPHTCGTLVSLVNIDDEEHGGRGSGRGNGTTCERANGTPCGSTSGRANGRRLKKEEYIESKEREKSKNSAQRFEDIWGGEPE